MAYSRVKTMLFLLQASCAPDNLNKPTDAEMDRVETALLANSCANILTNWDRRYNYGLRFDSKEELENAWLENRQQRPSSYNKNIVEIDLRQANFEEFGSGREAFDNYPPNSGGIDDRNYKVAFGSFNLETGELNITSCGENMGE